MENQLTQEERTLSDTLARVRDELNLKVHLAKAEVRTMWEEAETKWTLLQSRLTGVKLARDESAVDISAAVKQLFHELGDAYERIRVAVRDI